MERSDAKGYKEKIAEELDSILRYVGSFEIYSAKDLQALADIQSMLAGVNAAVLKIEESHQRRIHLMNELSKTLNEIESESTKFAEKHKKKSPE